jgi:hypothetical protein
MNYTKYSNIDEALASTSYLQLFETLAGSARIAILEMPDAISELRRYLVDRNMLAPRRFLAAELLHGVIVGFPESDAVRDLPAVYAAALEATVDGGAWGLPGHWDGPALEHLIQLGQPAVPALARLLADERRVPYTGSVRSTLGKVHEVRIKDLAANAIVRIVADSISIEAPAARRDVAIRRLAGMMKEVS